MYDPRSTLVALLAVLGTACAHQGAYGPAAGLETERVPIHIENSTSVNLRVYARHASGELPLGRVDALTERTASIPTAATGTVRLVARPAVDLGMGRGHVTEPISILQGQRITWRLHDSPGFSSIPSRSTVRVFACADEC